MILGNNLNKSKDNKLSDKNINDIKKCYSFDKEKFSKDNNFNINPDNIFDKI